MTNALYEKLKSFVFETYDKKAKTYAMRAQATDLEGIIDTDRRKWYLRALFDVKEKIVKNELEELCQLTSTITFGADATIYSMRVWIDEDFSVYMPDLPGCNSCANDEVGCLSNIKEAFEGLIESYTEDNLAIPFLYGGKCPETCSETLLVVTIPKSEKSNANN